MTTIILVIVYLQVSKLIRLYILQKYNQIYLFIHSFIQLFAQQVTHVSKTQ